MEHNRDRRPWENVRNRRRDFYIYEALAEAIPVGGSRIDQIIFRTDKEAQKRCAVHHVRNIIPIFLSRGSSGVTDCNYIAWLKENLNARDQKFLWPRELSGGFHIGSCERRTRRAYRRLEKRYLCNAGSRVHLKVIRGLPNYLDLPRSVDVVSSQLIQRRGMIGGQWP